MTSPIQQAVVLHEQDTLTLLRDWTTYLRAQLLLLDPDAGGTADAFEREQGGVARTAAERELAAIPPDRRRLFEQAAAQRCEERRHALEQELRAQAGGTARLTDPDELDRLVLGELLREAREPDASGHVLFPDADGDRVTWLELRLSALDERPDEATYRVATHGAARRERQLRVAAGVAIVLLLLSMGWYLLTPEERASGQVASGALANDQPLNAWELADLTLSGATTTTLRLTRTADTWPTDGNAGVRAAVTLPQRVCVPSALLDGATSVLLTSTGAAPTREYRLHDQPTEVADLVIAACDNPERQLSGVLTGLQAAPLGQLGEPQTLGAQPLTLSSVQVLGAAEAADIPQGAARIALTLTGSDLALDWAALTPTLRLSDGTQQTAPDLQLTADGVAQLRFLINAPAEALDAELRLVDPATRTVVRWQLRLTPPRDRQTLLRDTLLVNAVTSDAGGTLLVDVTNRGASPLTLLPTDLVLEQRGMRSPVPVVSGIETPLEAGESRTLMLTLPPDLRGTAALEVGAASYRLTSP